MIKSTEKLLFKGKKQCHPDEVRGRNFSVVSDVSI